MSAPERVVVGRVGRPHGLDGGFFVEQPSDDRRWFAVGAVLHVAGAPVKVVAARRGSGGRPVVRLDRSVERGSLLEVPREALPPTADGEYYTFELIGLEVVEQPDRSLGLVTAVIPGVANDALEVEGSLLLPLVEACVRGVDLAEGRITVAPGFADAT